MKMHRKLQADYIFEIDDEMAPILTIFGGKLTTYRKLSEHALKLSKYLSFSKKPDWEGGFTKKAENINISEVQIPNYLLERLNKSYGNKINKLNEYYLELKWGTDDTDDLYEFEVKYLVKEEMVTSIEDLLFRRTKLGIKFKRA